MAFGPHFVYRYTDYFASPPLRNRVALSNQHQAQSSSIATPTEHLDQHQDIQPQSSSIATPTEHLDERQDIQAQSSSTATSTEYLDQHQDIQPQSSSIATPTEYLDQHQDIQPQSSSIATPIEHLDQPQDIQPQSSSVNAPPTQSDAQAVRSTLKRLNPLPALRPPFHWHERFQVGPDVVQRDLLSDLAWATVLVRC